MSRSADGPLQTQITVVGVGGGGCNAIDRLAADHIQGIEIMAVNTDAQALRSSRAATRVCIGERVTGGLGSGGNALIGQRAAEDDLEMINAYLKGSDMVMLAAGMGGGTGTGATPVIASAAHDLGALTVATVTRPFSFEGRYRQQIADQGLNQLRSIVDTLIVVSNDRLLQLVARNTPAKQAFAIADSVLRQGIRGISDLVTQSGLINVDFNDIRTIMSQAGTAFFAVGVGKGQYRALDAVNQAITSPLLELNIQGATGIVLNVTGNENLGIMEIHEAAEIVAQTADPDANIIFGAVIDPSFPADQIKITLIATGFDPSKPATRRRRFYGTRSSAQGAPALEARAAVPQQARLPAPAPSHVEASPAELDMPAFLLRRHR